MTACSPVSIVPACIEYVTMAITFEPSFSLVQKVTMVTYSVNNKAPQTVPYLSIIYLSIL